MDPDRLAALRRAYDRPPLLETDIDPDPIVAFGIWFAEAVAAAGQGLLVEANAVVLATADAAGSPSARTVLLKAFDARGFVIYTNYASAKGAEIEANPRAALVFPWHAMDRQVRVTGTVQKVSRDETAAYFRSRPWSSQIGAWASHQSSVVADRGSLDVRFAALASRWPAGSDVPVPDFWGGLRISPESVELWQGRANRLHDRLRFRRELAADGFAGAWVIERLAP